LPFTTEASNITLHGNITLHENMTGLAADVHAPLENASRRLDLLGKSKGSVLKIMTEAMLFVCFICLYICYQCFTFPTQKITTET